MKVRERYEDYIPRKLRGLFFNPGVPLISGGGGPSGVDIGMPITKSVRFAGSTGDKITQLWSSSGDLKRGQISFWVKRGSLGRQCMFAGGFSTGSGHAIEWSSGDKLELYSFGAVASIDIRTTAIFRDTAKFYHVNVWWDTPQATAANRCGIEVNGVTQALDVTTYPALNANLEFDLSGNTFWIGQRNDSTVPFDGYLAQIFHTTAGPWAAATFGRTSADTGAWVNKFFGITYGNTGFWLKFATGAVASDLGIDSGTNAFTMTVTGLSVTAGTSNDWLDDTPTNTFCTLSSIDKNTTLSNAGLSSAGTGAWSSSRSTFFLSSGKWYWEASANVVAPTSMVGVGRSSAALNSYIGGDANGWSVNLNTGARFNAAAGTAYGSATAATSDIIMLAIDVDAGKIWWGKNGTWFTNGGVGDPAAGTNAAFTNLTSGPFSPTASNDTTVAGTVTLNFGQRAFTYTPPTGFVSLCTANLPTPSVLKGGLGFAAVTDTGTNIQTTLATARAGWGGDPYVEWFKDYSAAEGWRMRFSSDTANYLDTSNTNAKAAFPALTGADSYDAYAIRIGSAYGTATGTVSHTNGVADTITHNLNRSRNVVWLRRESAGGGDWFYFHPDLTAGNLLYVNLNAAQTADTSISSIGANSFVVASALPTGTYRYLVIGEVDGFCKLSKVRGNASTDGPNVWHGHSPKAWYNKRIDAATSPAIYNTARDTKNPATNYMAPNAAAGFSTISVGDFISSGMKLRTTDATMNGSSGDHVTISWAEQAFKYSNAR